MQVSYHKDYSGELGRDMEYKRYGYAGRPVVVFPTSSGRFYQFEDSGAIAALGEFIDTGRIQVWTLDGIDDETFCRKGRRPAVAAWSATKPISAMRGTRRCPPMTARGRRLERQTQAKAAFRGVLYGRLPRCQFRVPFSRADLRRHRA